MIQHLLHYDSIAKTFDAIFRLLLIQLKISSNEFGYSTILSHQKLDQLSERKSFPSA